MKRLRRSALARTGPAMAWLLVFLLIQAAAAQAPAEVAKSPNDEREYRALTLDNGLRVMLVSDPATDKAAAALDLAAGSNSDPAERPGLTHFLEHMLFLGTARYPEAGEYQEYIASHGGSHNAYTAYENTNYYFDIEKAWLEPALDRFSQFFIAPLFTPDYVDRERNAVHSEYQSNLQDDGRRSYSIFKQVLNPEHPLSRFSVGSLETLDNGDGESLRRALLEHYETWYSANLMSLAILGAEPLDELEALARRYFSAVPNRGAQRPAHDEPLFLEGDLPALLQIRPVRDSRSLSYTFPIAPAQEYWRSKPLNYIANLLGHEGEGSLLSLLRDKGWVNSLSAGGGMGYRDAATFSVSMSLTEAGLERVDEITDHLFQFIRLIGQEGIDRWRFDELGRMAQISFMFQEPSRPIGYVSSLASRLQEYPAAELLTAAYAYEDFDADLVRRYLARLRPDNLLLTLTHQGVETDRRDALFGGEYAVAPIAGERLAAWGGEADPALVLAEANPFLPENLAIKPYRGEPGPGGPEDKPELILDRGGVRLWFKQDNEYQVPRANFYLYAMNPLFEDSLRHSLLAGLALSLVNDSLNEFSYPANLAGVGFGVSRGARGFQLRVSGYQDKQGVLLEELLTTIQAADFQQERFDIIKAEMIRGLENADKQTPYVRLFQQAQALLVNPYWSEQERIAGLREISLDEVRDFVPQMLRGLTIDALYHGNVLEEDALDMMALVEEYLQASAEVERPPFGTVVKLEQGREVIQNVQVEHDDSAIVIYLQGPDDRLETRAAVSLLGTILRTPFYDTLRTERQLGYVVNAGTLPILKTNGLICYIESPGADPLTLEREIDDFLLSYEAELAAMPAQTFADIKAGLLNNMRQEPQRLSSLSSRFWGDIVTEDYAVDTTLQMADAIEALTHEEVLVFYRRHVIGPAAGRLVSRSVGRPHRALVAAAPPTDEAAVVVDDMNAFKREAEVFVYGSAD